MSVVSVIILWNVYDSDPTSQVPLSVHKIVSDILIEESFADRKITEVQ